MCFSHLRKNRYLLPKQAVFKQVLAVNKLVEQLKRATVMHPFPHCVLPSPPDWFIEMQTQVSCLLSSETVIFFFFFFFFFCCCCFFLSFFFSVDLFSDSKFSDVDFRDARSAFSAERRQAPKQNCT